MFVVVGDINKHLDQVVAVRFPDQETSLRKNPIEFTDRAALAGQGRAG